MPSNPHKTAARIEKITAIIAFLDLGPITVDQVKLFQSQDWKLAFRGAQLMGSTIKNPPGAETRAEIIKRMSERQPQPKPRRSTKTTSR